MAGIYIHVPFCSSRCIYCDFYSTTQGMEMRSAYVKALCCEIVARKHELGDNKISTIYFGGGTPSLLSLEQIGHIMQTIRDNFEISSAAEITLESNPDDVTVQLAEGWVTLGFNRVSLGLQTFDDNILRILRRRHTSATAREAVQILRAAGFRNLTLDLIYGLPNQTFDTWTNDVKELLALPVNHLSAYALSYEPGTVLTRMRDRGEIKEADEEMIRKMYLYLIEQAEGAGYNHYEISNFALPGYESRHNSSYWSGVPYLGLGPGAHSYDGVSVRRANNPDLLAYVKSQGKAPCSYEQLDEVQLYEEYLLTGLRTAKGISLSFIEAHFGKKVYMRMLHLAKPHLEKENLREVDGSYILTRNGILISDYIISDLMVAADE